ncbi:MAG: hypothetical protein GF400_02130 [Candidatus Eisenbacteria bacterium]|nr:hypothetical protein [Candidatus Eisenbacteria bacterium]
MLSFFCSDIHGHTDRYRKLFDAILAERPGAVFLGGDLLPHAMARLPGPPDFVGDYLVREFSRAKEELGDDYPRVFLILGNDDPRVEEEAVIEAESLGVWNYVHGRRVETPDFSVYGYSLVPPTPFLMKDWERYDVSRFVDPGCVSPEEGRRGVACEMRDVKYGTIARDLDDLAGDDDLERAIFLFHSPPYDTALDRAALDGRTIDHVPLDVHVGSIAIRRFVEERQPLVTLHGHVHEAARLTGAWREQIGRTHLFGGAHDGPELALVRFDTSHPERATRELI